MSIYRNLRCRILLFAIPDTVELSVLIGVGSWMCTKSSKVVLNIIASCPFTKSVSISAFAADAITFFVMAHTTCKGLFRGGSLTGFFVLYDDAELRQ